MTETDNTETEYADCIGCDEEFDVETMSLTCTHPASYDEPAEYEYVCDSCEAMEEDYEARLADQMYDEARSMGSLDVW